MGQWFKMVCHNCRTSTKCIGKLAEIELNISDALTVAFFATRHAGHQIELRGDEWTKDEFYSDECVNGYRVDDELPDGYAADTRKELAAMDSAYAKAKAKLPNHD